jgi:two-component system, response regulator PdtaR
VKVLRILIVEDDALMAISLEWLLEEMGHEVCAIASTEADAIDFAVRLRPDLMIVDGSLSQGSGVSAIDQILRAEQVPHFFLSGDIERIKAIRPGAVVLRKPFRSADLPGTIEKALEAAA